MRRICLSLLIGAISLFAVTQTQAQLAAGCVDGKNPVTGEDCVNTITTALPFLRIVPDARSGAMGDVGIAISPDANAMHFNASKLAFSKKDIGISATYTPWLRALGINDVYLAYLGAYKHIGPISAQQTVSVSMRFFSLGSISITDINNTPLGTDRPREFEIAAAYSRALVPDRFSAGLTLKYAYSRLAAGQFINGQEIRPASAIAADLSFTGIFPIESMEKGSNVTLGGAISNIGSKVSYLESANKDYIPTNLGIGTAFTGQIDEYNKFTIALDINKLLVPTPPEGDPLGTVNDADQNGVPDYKELSSISAIFSSFGDAPAGFSEELREFMWSVGAEYWYNDQFAVRTGYFYEHGTKGNRKFLTAGLGIRYSVFNLNFSYLIPTSNQRNPLDNTLRFSLLFDFDKNTGDPTPADDL